MTTYVQFPEPVGYLEFQEDPREVMNFLLGAISARDTLALTPAGHKSAFIINPLAIGALELSLTAPEGPRCLPVSIQDFHLEEVEPLIVVSP